MIEYERLKNDSINLLYRKFDLDNHNENYSYRLKRFNHSISVMEYALKLAKIYNYSCIDKVILAAIFHDYAKFESFEKYQEIVEENDLDAELLTIEFENIRHALLGGYVVERELGIHDLEVLQAIKYHATGKSDMNMLEKIIFISDYAEESREGEMFEKIRKASLESLDYAVCLEAMLSIENIKSRNLKVNPLTLECYEFYKNR